MKEQFLTAIGSGHTVTEFILPKDCPVFCAGCKACFYQNISVCPHANYTIPIWESIRAADLLAFASPVYVFHATAQMKALLDHYGSKWMAHSPEGAMFTKQAVILVNAIGQGMGNTVKDIKDSLDFWGVARTHVVTQVLFQPKWDLVSDKTKTEIAKKCTRVAGKIMTANQVKPRLKIRGLFFVMKTAQKMIDKSERKAGRPRTADYLHWEKHGWLGGKKPWKEQHVTFHKEDSGA
jgi:multimeric flavodoxin WrbA